MFFFLQSYLQGLTERYPEIFEGGGINQSDPSSVHSANFARKWRGYQSAAILAGEDLTKFNLILAKPLEECLLFLCYLTDKNQMEANIHRATMSKYKA